MAYTPDYSSGDISSASIDAIATGFIVVSQLAVIIVLFLIYKWVRRNR